MAALGITEEQRQELVKSITAIARPTRGKPR